MSLIQVSNLTFGYEGSFDNVFENASFSMDTNWRCGFIGRNGRGKTTFLNLLLGKYAYSGTISASVNFEYFPFEVENPDDTPLEIAESIMPDFEMWRLTRELNLLDADPGLLYRPYSTLSYGERTKVLLSILFIRENSFLLIDEPTNHLDIEARDTLARYLKSKKRVHPCQPRPCVSGRSHRPCAFHQPRGHHGDARQLYDVATGERPRGSI